MVVGETHHFRKPPFQEISVEVCGIMNLSTDSRVLQVKESNDFRREVPVPKMGGN